MAERLLSVGLDVGTTSTQLIVSELAIENRASSFAVPDMAITERLVRYQSPVHFTPLNGVFPSEAYAAVFIFIAIMSVPAAITSLLVPETGRK